jgi:hypothetical protein
MTELRLFDRGAKLKLFKIKKITVKLEKNRIENCLRQRKDIILSKAPLGIL